jgi:hypothetical protein
VLARKNLRRIESDPHCGLQHRSSANIEVSQADYHNDIFYFCAIGTLHCQRSAIDISSLCCGSPRGWVRRFLINAWNGHSLLTGHRLETGTCQSAASSPALSRCLSDLNPSILISGPHFRLILLCLRETGVGLTNRLRRQLHPFQRVPRASGNPPPTDGARLAPRSREICQCSGKLRSLSTSPISHIFDISRWIHSTRNM